MKYIRLIRGPEIRLLLHLHDVEPVRRIRQDNGAREGVD